MRGKRVVLYSFGPAGFISVGIPIVGCNIFCYGSFVGGGCFYWNSFDSLRVSSYVLARGYHAMTKISAKIVADSLSPTGCRLTTFVVEFPRIVLAELNTHRALSKNSASSRAIPFEKMLENVKTDPFIPIRFQKDHKGMQGTEYFKGEEHEGCVANWLGARDLAIEASLGFFYPITKQLKSKLAC